MLWYHSNVYITGEINRVKWSVCLSRLSYWWLDRCSKCVSFFFGTFNKFIRIFFFFYLKSFVEEKNFYNYTKFTFYIILIKIKKKEIGITYKLLSHYRQYNCWVIIGRYKMIDNNKLGKYCQFQKSFYLVSSVLSFVIKILLTVLTIKNKHECYKLIDAVVLTMKKGTIL